MAFPRDDVGVRLPVCGRCLDRAVDERLSASPRVGDGEHEQAVPSPARPRHARHDGLQVRLSGNAGASAVSPWRLAELLDAVHARAQNGKLDERSGYSGGLLQHEQGCGQPSQVGAEDGGLQIRPCDAERWRGQRRPCVRVPESRDAERRVSRVRIRVDAVRDVVFCGRTEVLFLPHRRGARVRARNAGDGGLSGLPQRHHQQRNLHARPRVVSGEIASLPRHRENANRL